jgi:two-component system nitrate/nitrite response regulator NarL
MRVVLVGSPEERARLRAGLDPDTMQVVGEFASLASAETSAVTADAILTVKRSSTGELPLAEPLTAREVQVLELLAEGLSNKAIAERLGISDQTVKFHVASISGKLGAANRTDIVRRAVRHGLITL